MRVWVVVQHEGYWDCLTDVLGVFTDKRAAEAAANAEDTVCDVFEAELTGTTPEGDQGGEDIWDQLGRVLEQVETDWPAPIPPEPPKEEVSPDAGTDKG